MSGEFIAYVMFSIFSLLLALLVMSSLDSGLGTDPFKFEDDDDD